MGIPIVEFTDDLSSKNPGHGEEIDNTECFWVFYKRLCSIKVSDGQSGWTSIWFGKRSQLSARVVGSDDIIFISDRSTFQKKAENLLYSKVFEAWVNDNDHQLRRFLNNWTSLKRQNIWKFCRSLEGITSMWKSFQSRFRRGCLSSCHEREIQVSFTAESFHFPFHSLQFLGHMPWFSPDSHSASLWSSYLTIFQRFLQMTAVHLVLSPNSPWWVLA